MIALFASVFFVGGPVVTARGELTRSFSMFLGAPLGFLKGIFGYGRIQRELVSLRLENEELKAKLLAFGLQNRTPEFEGHRLYAAKVYSDYPFNNRSVVTINAGRKAGIIPGLPVTVGGSRLFFGQIAEVFESYAFVRTVRDAEWKIPVRIGEEAIDALFVGGREPKLTLVVKGGFLKSGQPVYAASRDFPYGLKLGEVGDIRTDRTVAFQQASIVFPYEPGEMSEVFVLLP